MPAIVTRKPGGKFYRSVGAVAARYSKHPKTIDRWLKDPAVGFPEPDLVIRKVRHWLDATLDEFDEAQRDLARNRHRTAEAGARMQGASTEKAT